VRKWLKALPLGARKEIGSDILRAQWQWPASRPLVDGLGGGLYEVRTKFEKVQYRVLFCIERDSFVLLHGFVKKARTAPDALSLGRQRQMVVAHQEES
jgi:phage-related protein